MSDDVDDFLFEAMREVDAMLPHTRPIAPSRAPARLVAPLAHTIAAFARFDPATLEWVFRNGMRVDSRAVDFDTYYWTWEAFKAATGLASRWPPSVA